MDACGHPGSQRGHDHADTHGDDGAGRGGEQAGEFLHGAGETDQDRAWVYHRGVDHRDGYVHADTGAG